MKCSATLHGLTVAVALVLLFAFAILILLLPHAPFSERENRALTLFPTPSAATLATGEFSRELSDFYTDQFPLRTAWLSLMAELEHLSGAREVGGILLGGDGYLIPRDEYDDLSIAHENASTCRTFAERMAADGIPLTVAVAPRAVDVLTPYLPALYDPTRACAVYPAITEQLPSALLLKENLQRAAAEGASVWYRTDHHWTTDGAYLAYTALCPALGITPFPRDAFTRVTVSNDFLGTSAASSRLWRTTSDEIVLYRYEGDERMEVYHPELRMSSLGFYHENKLATRDQYAVFLGGNYAHLSIRDLDAPDKPTLLLFKDSFANALIPFLARHFHLEVIDLRFVSGSVSTRIEALPHTRTLLLFGADTLATHTAIRKIAT